MAGNLQADVIKAWPIGQGLDGFRDRLNEKYGISVITEQSDLLVQFNDEELENIILDLLDAICVLRATPKLFSANSHYSLKVDLAIFSSCLNGTSDGTRSAILVLCKVVNEAPDEEIWDAVYKLVAESTPPPRVHTSVNQTPNQFATSGIMNSSEHSKNMDSTLKEELSPIFVGVPGFYKAFFCKNMSLQTIFENVFVQCQAGEKPLYQEESSWQDWPGGCKKQDMLSWISAYI